MSIHSPGSRFPKVAALVVAGTNLAAAATLGLGHPDARPILPPRAPSDQGTIVTLGDSIAFGADPNKDPANPADFPSYADKIGQDKGWNVVNFGQPGETTASLNDINARNNGGWITDPATGKRIHDRPLHQIYNVDQLDAAVAYLKEHPETRLVTLTIGGNDLLLLEKDSKKGKLPVAVSEILGLPDTAEDIYDNAKTSLEKIRSVYSGPIEVTNTYSTNYSNPINALGLKVEGFALGLATGSVNKPGEPAKIADVYNSFEKATAADPSAKGDPGVAGLLIPYQGGYDIHPSKAGRELIAKTIEAAGP